MSIAYTSYRNSPEMPENLARALKARTDLFGYHPDIRQKESGCILILQNGASDVATIERMIETWTDKGRPLPVPVRAKDGAIMAVGDRVRLEDGRAAKIDAFLPEDDQASASPGGAVHVLPVGATHAEKATLDSVGGRWA